MQRINDTKIDDPVYYKRVWSVEANTRPWYDATRQRELLKHVKDGDTVLEVGAGVFGAIQYLLEHTEVRPERMVVLDFSHTARDIVTAKHSEIEWRCVDLERCKYGTGFFDRVIAGEVIEHMEDPKAFVRKLALATKPGGSCMLSTVNTESENARKLHPPLGHYPEHLWKFELHEFFPMFWDAGFVDVRAYPFGDYQMVEAWR